MPTFLVTSRMSAPLAARVEASVSGQRAVARAAQRRRLVSLVRLGSAVAFVSAIALIVNARQRSAEQLESTRTSLLDALHAQFRSLTPGERRLGERVAAILSLHAGDYRGDYVAEAFRSTTVLVEALQGGAIYIRGPIAELSEQSKLVRSASESAKDAFLLCLLDPPDNLGEKALRAKARIASAGGKGAAAMSAVERLFPLLAVTPMLRPEWERAILTIDSQAELDRFDRAFRKSPDDAAVRAAKATWLLLVMDEPGDGPGPTELDGERAHDVRVSLVNLSTGQTELRLRRRVDPTWLSATTRAEHARGVDGCSLALAVRAGLSGKTWTPDAAPGPTTQL